jgi:hypothetical protein
MCKTGQWVVDTCKENPILYWKGDRLKAKYLTIKRLRYTCRFLVLNTTGTKEQGTLRKTFTPIPQLERSKCRELYPTTVIILIVINTIKMMTVVGVLRDDCPRWAVASFQACCSYSKWRPRQRLSTEGTEVGSDQFNSKSRAIGTGRLYWGFFWNPSFMDHSKYNSKNKLPQPYCFLFLLAFF